MSVARPVLFLGLWRKSFKSPLLHFHSVRVLTCFPKILQIRPLPTPHLPSSAPFLFPPLPVGPVKRVYRLFPHMFLVEARNGCVLDHRFPPLHAPRVFPPPSRCVFLRRIFPESAFVRHPPGLVFFPYLPFRGLLPSLISSKASVGPSFFVDLFFFFAPPTRQLAFSRHSRRRLFRSMGFVFSLLPFFLRSCLKNLLAADSF